MFEKKFSMGGFYLMAKLKPWVLILDVLGSLSLGLLLCIQICFDEPCRCTPNYKEVWVDFE